MEAAADEEQPGVGCSRAAGRRQELECRAHALLLPSLVWPCCVAFVQKPVSSMLGGSPAFLHSLNLSNLGCIYRLSLASS